MTSLKRYRCALAPLNDHQIAILGGHDGTEKLNSIMVFDAEKGNFLKRQSDGLPKFMSMTNQSVKILNNTIETLVEDD